MRLNQEICLEELDRTGEDDDGFVRCVALPGGQPGLALDRTGDVRWMPDHAEACGLWISADGKLVLLRAEGAAEISVERAGRSTLAPVGQPVVLRDQDLIRVGDRNLRLHVHGETEGVHAPERLTRSALSRLLQAAAAAAAVALGGAAVASAAPPSRSPPPPVEVRSQPPAPPPMRQVLCTITKQTVVAGKLQLEATCPAGHNVSKGQSGYLLDPKGTPVPNGHVAIKTLTGNALTAEAPALGKPVPGAKLRFHVYY